jgi:hypothetical protein
VIKAEDTVILFREPVSLFDSLRSLLRRLAFVSLTDIIQKDDGHEGVEKATWIFEGRLRYGRALVGTWRSASSTYADRGVRGIFSLRKRTQ